MFVRGQQLKGGGEDSGEDGCEDDGEESSEDDDDRRTNGH